MSLFTSKNASEHKKSLGSLCQNQSSILTKVALLTRHNIKYSIWTEKLILLYEYLQLISQAFTVFSVIQNDPGSSYSVFTSFVLYFFKLINPSYLLSYSGTDKLTSFCLVALICYTIVRILLYFYAFQLALRGFQGNPLLLTLWRWTFKLQARIGYFFVSSFWVRLVLTSSDDTFSLFGMGNAGNILLSTIMIGVEFAFSIVMEIQFGYVLPTKSFLSEKSPVMKTLCLTQKFLCQLLEMCFQSEYVAMLWVTGIFNVSMSLIRNYHFYHKLPLYKYQALLLQGDLIKLTSAANGLAIAQTIGWSLKTKKERLDFMVITWLILALMLIKIFRDVLKTRILNLLMSDVKRNKSYSCELLLHKMCILKDLEKVEKLPGVLVAKNNFAHLLISAVKSNLATVFGSQLLSEQEESLSHPIEKKRIFQRIFQRIFMNYFEELAMKNPKNTMIKLFQAQIYSKDPTMFLKTIKIAAELKRKDWFTHSQTCSFLLYKIEKSLMANYDKSSVHLDLLTYIHNKISIDSLKEDIVKIAENKITVCHNIIDNVCNFGTIYNSSQIVSQIRTKVNKKIQHLAKTLPDHYVSPFLLFAEYSLLVDYSFKDSMKYRDQYIQRYYKHEKQFSSLKLTEENLYQDQNAFLILSGNNGGKIIYSNHALENLCGNDGVSFIGSHVLSLFPSCLRPYYEDFFRQIFETGNQDFMNKIVKTFMFTKDQHLVEVEFFTRIHPYIAESLCLQMIIRPIPGRCDYLLLTEDGIIEAGTKNVSSISGSNISSFSQDLYKVNLAINIIQKIIVERNIPIHNQSSPLTENLPKDLSIIEKEAVALFDLYSLKGKRIEILANLYYCKVSILPTDDKVFKRLVYLEKASEIEELLTSKRIATLKNASASKVLTSHSDQQQYSENIDCVEVTENERRLTTRKEDYLMSTERDLISPRTTQAETPFIKQQHMEHIVATSLKLKASSRVREAHDDDGASIDSIPFTNLENNFEENGFQKGINIAKATSNKNGEIRDYKSLKAAIQSQTYPKSFILLCIAFYLVIFMTLLSQILLKVNSDNTMQDLVIKKNLLKNAQFFSFKAQQTQMNALTGVLTLRGNFQQDQANTGLESAMENLVERVSSMEKARKSLTEELMSLKNGYQTAGIEKTDIDIYGSYYTNEFDSVRRLDLFQASQVIENAVHYVLNLPSHYTETAYYAFYFLMINVLDTFLIKCTELTQNFIDSVQNQKEYFQKVVNLCLLVTPFTLLGIIFVLVFIIWKQYNIGKSYLLSFVKLRPKEVKDIQTGLMHFKKSIISEEIFSREYYLKHFKEFTTTPSSKDKNNSLSDFQNNRSQDIIYTTYSKIYFGYVIRATLYLSSLIFIMIWNYVSTEHTIKVIYNKQSQLEYADYISERISVSYAAFGVLFTANNTLPVEGGTSLAALEKVTEDLVSITELIPSKFLNIDDSYDPEVKKVIYGNYSCEGISGMALYECQLLLGRGQKVNLLPQIAAYSHLIATKISDYNKADKSTVTTIMTAAYINIDPLLPEMMVSTAEAQLIADYVDLRLTSEIDSANRTRTVILVVFAMCLLGASILIWFDVLKKLGEVDNDFKKVIQTLPPRLILSSFLIKQFLKKTSTEPLMF